MIQPRQKQLKILGDFGCYFLCIVHLAENALGRYMDAYHLYLELTRIDAGGGKTVLDATDCTVWDAGRALSLLTGQTWKRVREIPSYVPVSGDHVVQKWTRTRGGKVTEHFVCPDYDPLGDSQTVKYGSIESLRVFRRIA